MEYFINKESLESRGWKYLAEIFPLTSNDIQEWLNSTNELINTKNISELKYYSRDLYDYFDAVKIHVSVFKKDKRFTCYVNKELCYINRHFFFYDRIPAEICGFINAMNLREKTLLEYGKQGA